jgi:uncharacterized membrane protein YhaH (DUF805 family)
MSFNEAISDGFSKYAMFSGRSSRSAYWWWYLFAVLVGVGASILDMIIGTTFVLSGIAGLALFIPNLAILVRRFHDSGHSGWWVLILLVPVVGFVVWLIFALTETKPANEWGEGPDTPVSA